MGKSEGAGKTVQKANCIVIDINWTISEGYRTVYDVIQFLIKNKGNPLSSSFFKSIHLIYRSPPVSLGFPPPGGIETERIKKSKSGFSGQRYRKTKSKLTPRFFLACLRLLILHSFPTSSDPSF